MSSKHLRRIQNKIDDEKTTNGVDSNSETEEIDSKSRFNKFALLDDEEKKSDKSEDEGETEEQQHTNPATSTGVVTKKRKQKKKKTKQNQAVSEIEIAEIEQKSLEESSSSDTVLLKIDPRSLNPDNELRKLLGKAFGGAPENQQRVGGRMHLSLPGRMVKAKPEWPRLQQLGLYMAVEKEEGAVKWYRFRHTEQYQLLQQHFWLYQKHMDHESIMNSILVKNAYHLDSLLLLSEIWRVQEDAQNSRDAIAMGLLACESAFHSSFQLLSMDHRLSYTWRENRIFYLLLHWHIFHLLQRRCFSTALQFAKIVFMKDPMEDPLAILLLIDSISLKAKEYSFLIGFYQEFKDPKNLDMLPNFLFSMALAHFFLSIDSKEQHADQHTQFAEQFLELALTRFPFVLGQILDKLNIQPDSKVDNHSRLGTVAYSRESDGMKLVTEIYLHHSLELWRMPNVISWLEATTHVILPRLSSTLKNETDEWTKKRKRIFVGMPPNVMRHAILHSIRAGGIADPGESSIVDPYPPPTGASFADYQPINLDDVHTGNDDSSDSVLVEFFRSLVPQEYQPQLDSVGGAVRNYATELYSRLRDGLSLNENSQENAQNNDVQNDENREVHSPDIAHDNAEELPGTSASMAAPMPTNHTDSSSENREKQNETNIPGENESQSKEEEQ